MPPFYEYACANGHVVEEFRKVPERNEPLACPSCKAPMHPQMSATPGIVKNPAVARKSK
jgi:putative FmdB family regulatory protein